MFIEEESHKERT